MSRTLVVISVDLSELPEHTDEQFREWVRYCVGDIGGIDLGNPLHAHDMQAAVREISR